MLWIEAVRTLSAELNEPFALEFVWRHKYNLDKLAWLNLMREKIGESDLKLLTVLSARLKEDEPPQYLVGWAEFCDLRLKVDQRVLIPRPETEELVALILKENKKEKLHVLDIGTGSGAIALALAKARKEWQVTASDLSESALELASENAKEHGLLVEFVESDVMDQFTDEKFDLIVSNPPYIAFDETYEMDKSVIKYEPDSALFAAHQGYAIYEKIARQAGAHLNPGGKLYFEIGYKQGPFLQQLFQAHFTDRTVSIHQDVFGKDRMISVS